jgi:hypothetical protein
MGVSGSTARRIVAKVCRYLAVMNVTVPYGLREELERIVLEDLREMEKLGAFFGREENERNGDEANPT